MNDYFDDGISNPTLAPESGETAGDQSPSDVAATASTPGAEAGEGGDPKKKRRRRRRGGRSGKKPGTDTAAGPASEQPEADSADDDGDDTEDAPAPALAPATKPEPRTPKAQSGPNTGAPAPRAPRPPKPAPADLPSPAGEPDMGGIELKDPKKWEEIFEGKTFESLGLRNSVLKGVAEAGFKSPTKIQAEMIPLVLAGRDVLGQSRTGTGKTAAFGLPLFHCATRDLPFQSLILAPTRELAIQIAAELTELGKCTPIRVSAVYGGQAVHAQAKKLDKGPEIIVATPGRLMDMVERGHITLKNVKFAVLDEVDRMLDIGFRDDIRKILGGIKGEHQTVFVSATISDEIEKLARTYMKDPAKLVTTGGSLTVSLVEQHYIAVQPWDKRKMLLHILTHEQPELTIIFCRMKRTVDEVTKFLVNHKIDAHGMHGDLQQGRRNSVMARLREGQLGVLVASDLAARGLDVDGISHVINYDLPEDPEVYIHRIGRTARAGRGGVAWALVTPEQGELLTAIEMLANTHIPEKKYPDFKPNPLPPHVEAQRRADQDRQQNLKTQSRFNTPSLPTTSAPAPAAKPAATPGRSSAPAVPSVVTVSLDASRFPGGIVPTKLPPKRMMGKVRTSRSKPAPAPAPARGAPPATPPGQGGEPA